MHALQVSVGEYLPAVYLHHAGSTRGSMGAAQRVTDNLGSTVVEVPLLHWDIPAAMSDCQVKNKELDSIFLAATSLTMHTLSHDPNTHQLQCERSQSEALLRYGSAATPPELIDHA